ncbi:MAG: pantoate--beta-alanine ligase [Flavobacteriaceae bacterium]
MMRVFNKNQSISDFLESLSTQNFSVGFVPTMGALHNGHLSLIKQAIDENDHVIVSIYINPTQFDDKHDLDKYPYNLEEDIKILKTIKNDKLSLFTPSNFEIYGKNISKENFNFEGLDQHMEGKFRPGHFAGVATVVKKLLEVVRPNKAYFGEKDYQQLLIVNKLAELLKFPISIIGCPISRDENGLALSSRNSRLSTDDRLHSSVIYKNLLLAKDQLFTTEIANIKASVQEFFLNDPKMELEYFEIVEADNLESTSKINKNTKYRALIAVHISNVRLIDNIALN